MKCGKFLARKTPQGSGGALCTTPTWVGAPERKQRALVRQKKLCALRASGEEEQRAEGEQGTIAIWTVRLRSGPLAQQHIAQRSAAGTMHIPVQKQALSAALLREFSGRPRQHTRTD